LNRANSDLTNLQASTRLALVLLGRDLTIRRFSSQAEKQLNLTASDVGRPFGHIRHNLVFASASVPNGRPAETGVERPLRSRRASGRAAAVTAAKPLPPPRLHPHWMSKA
jgi:two-component system CheB/CheR fusion protein